jgi:plastocyanin
MSIQMRLRSVPMSTASTPLCGRCVNAPAGNSRRRALAGFTGLLLVLLSSALAARNWNVQAGGSQLEFVPRELSIAPGDTVTWSNLGGLHNVVADDGAFRCANGCDGQGGNGAPSSQIWHATVSFGQPGRFGYFCEPHGHPGGGMYGVITVIGDPPVPVPFDGLLLRWLLVGAMLTSAMVWLRQRARRETAQ